jgi:hypothetical protein
VNTNPPVPQLPPLDEYSDFGRHIVNLRLRHGFKLFNFSLSQRTPGEWLLIARSGPATEDSARVFLLKNGEDPLLTELKQKVEAEVAQGTDPGASVAKWVKEYPIQAEDLTRWVVAKYQVPTTG